MDGQRWYDEGHYGEEPNRYGALEDNRYAQPEDFNPYGEQPPAYQDQQASAPVRRPRGPQRRGQRSGLVLPDAPGGFESYDGHDDSAERGTPSGPPVSPVPPPPAPPVPGVFHAPTEAIQAPRLAPAATYRSRRPGLAMLLTLGGLVAELVLLKVLLANLFHSSAAAISGTVGSLFAIAGVPMVILGLYGLATGAATVSGPHTGRAWLRTPLAYLPIGLILIIAAGLAA